MSTGFVYYMVKFDYMKDTEKVMTGGLWIVQGYYLAVKHQTPDFAYGEEVHVYGKWSLAWERPY